MVIGFNKQFPAKILAGTKKHTIREDSHNRWQKDRIMHMATGVRTKQYKCFKQDVCTGTQTIEIIRKSDYLNETVVRVDGIELSIEDTQQLAYNDGFESIIDFWLWFNEDFKGKIIHWTDLRYGKE